MLLNPEAKCGQPLEVPSQSRVLRALTTAAGKKVARQEIGRAKISKTATEGKTVVVPVLAMDGKTRILVDIAVFC